ncbi:MAG TPA: ATP-binding protein [Candidatus Nanoarchaeia archaeon]|nr:ATP-binding protein [Candidatus Nanoarchaeia archaeon]
MEVEKLVEWNPWWEKEETIEELRGKPRPQYTDIVDAVAIKEIIIITGVRRSGKSTLLYEMISQLLKKNVDKKQILFINLEDKKFSKDSIEEIYACYRENINPDKKAYIFLDEVHKKDGWEGWIRKKYDLKTNNKFVISGSCSYLLKKEYATLLTGRNLTFEVFPLSFKEFLEFKEVSIEESNVERGIVSDQTKHSIMRHLQEYVMQGGFPEITLKEERYKMKVLKQYFDDILYKDIIDRYNLNSQKTKDLALFLITNVTSFFSLRSIRSIVKISYDTIKEYISYYQEAFLLFTLDHFSYSLKEQKTLPSKVYCVDNGLRNAVAFKFSKDDGKLVENLVFLELRRNDKEVYYWKKKGEVDFIVKNKDQSLTAINVSYTDEILEREARALEEFKKEMKTRCKELLMITKTREEKVGPIRYVPLWKWLLIKKKE